jgi:hypothetical protein
MFEFIGIVVVIAALIWAANKYMPQAWKDWIKAKFSKATTPPTPPPVK